VRWAFRDRMTASLPEVIHIDGVEYRRGPLATRVSSHVMYDCHLFRELKGSTLEELVEDWRKECEKPDEKYGPSYLCPLSVLSGDKELRRVGQMVFPDTADTDRKLGEWLRLAKADPDITRILAERVTEQRSGDA
jgi:hypothetical protein